MINLCHQIQLDNFDLEKALDPKQQYSPISNSEEDSYRVDNHVSEYWWDQNVQQGEKKAVKH